VSFDARLEGELPAWLRGDLVRTAPAVFERGGWHAEHWFDGLGLLYGFQIEQGRVHFRQTLMATAAEKATRQGGRYPSAQFSTPLRRSFWKRLLTPKPPITDNTNVHILPFGDERVALTEGPHQWVVDPITLDVRRLVAYDDDLGDMPMLAHAHFDFERQRIVNLGTQLGAQPALVIYEHAPNSRTRTVVGRLPMRRLPYVHAFGLTPRHIVIIGHPLTVNPLSLLWSNDGFIDRFQWRPGDGMRLWVMDRQTGAVREHHAPAGFVFHVVNAFDDGDTTVLDVAAYRDPGIVRQLSRAHLEQSGLPALSPSIRRYRLTAGRADAQVETLLEEGFELPQVSYRQKNGQRHQVAWGARIAGGAQPSTIIRLDERGTTTHSEAGVIYGEPVFVARPGATAEDDGVLLTVGSAVNEERSCMAVLDAATLQVRARAEVPLPVPLGFHGSFFR
jgi:carotenoid cleavage dioxygenase-like enzyme